MRTRIALTSIPAVAVAAVFGTGCEIAGSSPGDMPAASLERSLSSTAAGVRVTGGGRIDPNPLEKTTFGFTVDGTSGPPFRGQLQAVFHFSILKAHSVVIDEFELMATCAHFRGTVRTSDGHNNHRFRAVACDNGEPGSSPGTGPDQFGICIDHHRSTDPLAQNPVTGECQRDPEPTELTGGNIQLHGADAQGRVSGEGFAAKVNIAGQVTTAAQASLSASGGIGLADSDSVGVAGSVTSHWATTVTTGAVAAATVSAQTVASVENVSVLGGRIRAKFVNAVASSTANATAASSNALGSVVTDLEIDGIAVGSGDHLPGPNARIDLSGVGFVLLNEQIRVGDGVRISGLSVNMIHVVLLNPLTGAKTGDIIVGSASSAASF